MSVEIVEVEKDSVYTVNSKEVYKDTENKWIAREELTTVETAAFASHRAARFGKKISNFNYMATTKTLSPAEIAEQLSKILNMPVSDKSVHDFDDHYALKIAYYGALEHEQNTALTALGKTSIKRSGAGMSITIEIIK